MTSPTRARILPGAVLTWAVLAFAPVAPVFGLAEFADGEIFLSLDASIAADSNITSSAAELSDTIFAVTPGISWERSRGLGTISLSAECEIERADEYDFYDSENYSASFSLDLPATPSGRLRGGLSASYFDGSRVDAFQNTRLSESSYNLGVRGSYQVTPKINGRVSGSYAENNPDELASYESTSMSLGLGYNVRPAASLFCDVRFTDSSSEFSELTEGGTDTSGNAVLVGLDGEITPKLTGRLGFGYDWSETEVGGVVRDYTGPTYDVSLTWQPRERTSLAISGAQGIQSTSTGGTEYFSVSFEVDQEIGLNMSANAGISHRTSEFALGGREDEVMQATLGFRYAMTRQISFGLTYTYTDADSDLALVNYSRSVWTLTASARF